jgi:CRISPR system Cascade subunit CasB
MSTTTPPTTQDSDEERQPTASRWLTEARLFVSEIQRIAAGDAGARAALRSGVGKDLDSVRRMHRIVAPRLPPYAVADEDVQRAHYTIAALVAAYHRGPVDDAGDTSDVRPGDGGPDDGAAAVPHQSASGDAAALRRARFGESLGLAYAAGVALSVRSGGNGLRENAAESRLNVLSRQSTAGLHRHLPGAVRQLCDRGCPPDWARLLVDLRSWPRDRRRIARWWLQDFYRAVGQPVLEAARRSDDAGQAETPVSAEEAAASA